MRLQTNHTAAKPALSKIGQLLPPQKIAAAAANPQRVAAATAAAPKALGNAIPKIASLYRVRLFESSRVFMQVMDSVLVLEHGLHNNSRGIASRQALLYPGLQQIVFTHQLCSR